MDIMTDITLNKRKNNLKTVMKYAFLSRLVIWIIALVSHGVVSEHDSSASLILYDSTQHYSLLDRLVIKLFGVFIRWDSFFFYHIAENGYIYEQETAFFPFLPFMMRFLSNTSILSIFYINI